MKQLKIVPGYVPKLSLRDTQRAIKFVKDTFQRELAHRLNLQRISAPLIVESSSGINDDLSGVERKVTFDLGATGTEAEVVQSLAKWKRMALAQYGFGHGEGLYTDMSAIRRDDDMDNDHSIYVDQWDWEKIISPDERTEQYLKDTVKMIVDALVAAKEKVQSEYPVLDAELCSDCYFITSEQLRQQYPDLTAKERERAVTAERGTVFIMQIGDKLGDGKPHDGRAPDYDDWALNGDLLFWDSVRGCPIELSSMGIRVDAQSLVRQLEAAGCTDRMRFDYHKAVAAGELPLTIGGGIGQSRMCMLLLEKMHVGEVQCSIWPKEMREKCAQAGVQLL